MKPIYLAALILASVALMHGATGDESRHSERVAPKPPPKTIRAEHAPHSHDHAGTGNAAALRQPPPIATGAAAGLTVAARPRAVRQSTVLSARGPSINNAPHRSANPAAIGGPANPSTHNTAVINGTVMRRKQ